MLVRICQLLCQSLGICSLLTLETIELNYLRLLQP